MNTKLIMISSAILLIFVGISLTFFPQEIAGTFLLDAAGSLPLIMQLLGAMYFAFGMLNWTAKENLLGGIYGRPVVIGNLTHFVIGALALLKVVSTTNPSPLFLSATFVYTVYAILFGMIYLRHPKQTQQ